MMLLGESDAHCHNIGAICDKEKKSCGLAKVDHDYTSLLKTKEIKTRSLKKLSEELLYKSKVKNGMYDGALQNSYDIAYAMEIISSIPNDLWKKIVTERINTYISETGILLSNSKIKKMVEKYMQVKESANYYAKSLYLEGALLKKACRYAR